jgi:AAA+ superfamily predicted ATPase
MTTPRKPRTYATDRRKLKALDVRMPLGAEHETQRALWTLRLLLKAGVSARSRSALDDPDTLTELGLDSAELDTLSPRLLRRWLEHRLQQLEQRELAPDATMQNAAWLAEWLGLSEVQRKLLAFASTAEASEAVSVCLQPFARLPSSRAIQLLASVLGESADEVRASLAPQSALMVAGLLLFRPGRDAHTSQWIGLDRPFDRAVTSHYERAEDLFAAVCPVASEATLELSAFDHLSADLAVLMSLLRGAHRERSAGINVLLYGPPGSGKSQLVRSIARALGVPLYHVPDTTPDGDVLKGAKRMAALGAMQCLLQSAKPALVLFDEIEDSFPWSFEGGWLRQRSGIDKARTNRLLEENAVPCLWVGNGIAHLDPAFVRRYSLVVEVATPPRQVRERLMSDYGSGLEISAELRRRLADNTWVVPADAARAARVTRLVRRGDAADELEVAAGALPAPVHALADGDVFERALRGGRRPEPKRSGELDYDPRLVNTSVPLERLTLGLKERGEGSVCLYGPPGTGKTAFARQLANALGRPLLHRSAGDLLDMYVGGTERAIVDMFDEASRSDCVLLLDEAEGMLRHRSTATRGFEVTQVNELLVRMEAFRGIFLCATNGFEALDPAALRRFALRIEFSPLDANQKLLMLERTAQQLGLALDDEARGAAQRRLSRLSQLTPGDYASLLRGRLLLGEPTVESLVADLERAHSEKRAARRVGFR